MIQKACITVYRNEGELVACLHYLDSLPFDPPDKVFTVEGDIVDEVTEPLFREARQKAAELSLGIVRNLHGRETTRIKRQEGK